MAYSKFRFLLVLAGCFFGGCLPPGWRAAESVVAPSPVRPGEQARIEKAVVYLKSNVPRKFNWDGVFLESRETIFFKTQELNAPLAISVSMFDDVESHLDLGRFVGRFEVLVNREDGVLCLQKECVRIEAICPPKNNHRNNEICKYW